MKIYFITSKLDFKLSGGSVMDLDLRARTFQEFGVEVAVITVFSNSNKLVDTPYRIIEENIASRSLLGIHRGIWRILKKYSGETDVFYVDGQFLYAAGAYRRFGGGVPVVACFNREMICWPDNRSNFFRSESGEGFFPQIKKRIRFFIEGNLGTLLASGIDLITFTNPHLKRSYEEFGLNVAKNSLVVGDSFDYRKTMRQNGISENSYRERYREGERVKIFYSSRMVPGKGFDLLLSAFAKVKNRDKFQLILGGDGPEEVLVRAMIKELHLESHVLLTGWVTKEQVFRHLEEAEIFVQAKWRSDMTSISLLEAMSFGLPAILPGGGGLEWVAGPGALYFKDEDPDDLAAKIEQLGASRELREKLSANCYARLADDDHNYKKQLGKILKEIDRLTAYQK